jgi:hypothetical protein
VPAGTETVDVAATASQMVTEVIQAIYVAITGILSAPNPHPYPRMTDVPAKRSARPRRERARISRLLSPPPPPFLPCLQPHPFPTAPSAHPQEIMNGFSPMEVRIRAEQPTYTARQKKNQILAQAEDLSLQLTSIMCSTSPVSLSYRLALLIRANRLLSRGFCLRSSAL